MSGNVANEAEPERLSKREMNMAIAIVGHAAIVTDDFDGMTIKEIRERISDELGFSPHANDFERLVDHFGIKAKRKRFFSACINVAIAFLVLAAVKWSWHYSQEVRKAWPNGHSEQSSNPASASSELESHALFGDSFGVINAMLSGIALIAASSAVYMQRKELSLQRNELRLARNEAKRSADAHEKSIEVMSKQIDLMNEAGNQEHLRFLNKLAVDYLANDASEQRSMAVHYCRTVFGFNEEDEEAKELALLLAEELSGITGEKSFHENARKRFQDDRKKDYFSYYESFFDICTKHEVAANYCVSFPGLKPPVLWFNIFDIYSPQLAILANGLRIAREKNPDRIISPMVRFDAHFEFVEYLRGVYPEL